MTAVRLVTIIVVVLTAANVIRRNLSLSLKNETAFSKVDFLSDARISHMFPILGREMHTSVTKKDIEIGHRWRTYLFPIDKRWNEEALLKYMNQRKSPNCFTKSCDSITLTSHGLQFDDFFSEVIILRKLLAALQFVKDMDDADLILVPVLGVTSIVTGCRNFGKCKDEWFGNLTAEINLKSDMSKKHLYLATQDFSQNHEFFRKQHTLGNIVVNLGPRGLVVPYLNSNDSLQPMNWKGCKAPSDRNTFLSANFGIRGAMRDRYTIAKQLDSYNGTKLVARQKHAKIQVVRADNQDVLSDSVFSICPPGDLPISKRLFDSILSCSIPVVIRRDVEGIGTTYWSNVDFQQHPMFNIADVYPSLGFPYSDLVVEVNETSLEKGVMNFLESIPPHIVKLKWDTITKIRNRFLWDFNGTVDDAFSAMIETLESLTMEGNQTIS